ncbi:MAG: hypothetical protein ACPHUF_03250 [Gammaproteobacteria bacterium]
MSLKAKLDEIKAGAMKRIPPEILEQMLAATDALRDSGILDGVIKAGTPLPPFELKNQAGEVVKSADLLAKGAVVLTVFRGHW